MINEFERAQEITSRYVLPVFEEKTANGYKRHDPYTKLFEERIIFLGQPIDDTVANDVMAQLLTLDQWILIATSLSTSTHQGDHLQP